jgi:hypothetical protein
MMGMMEKHKNDLKKLLKANVARLHVFPESLSFASKMTAEQKVEDVIEKLRNHQALTLSKLMRPENKSFISGVNLSPIARKRREL